ncbi:MAG: AbiH family protein [Bacteroidaceae bacterium]|nr:AbiH family protein [Bacteroidaceae bacterium]
MNRIVLIGNGFDLAHELRTSYEDFINWYWDQRLHNIRFEHKDVSRDLLCSMKILSVSGYDDWSLYLFHHSFFNNPSNNEGLGKKFIKELKNQPDYFEVTNSPFFENICKSIETKKWVDIENEYYRLLTKYVIDEKSGDRVYDLNNQLAEIRRNLIEYLDTINSQHVEIKKNIWQQIYSPIEKHDLSIGSKHAFEEYIGWCMKKEQSYWIDKMKKFDDEISYADVDNYKKAREKGYLGINYPRPFMMPDDIMLLSFNYTKTASLYETKDFKVNYIHGQLEDNDSIIFGYGDELDDNYKKLQEFEDNDCLYNIKSIKYLESDNYRKVLDFIESDLFQVCIMGHSCGNSDRTLLNTLFEHKNCISIKPYYHQWNNGTDNYLELVQNISRNFKDMKLMRDRVVNKTFCDKF